jgi:hypothetical protein
VNVSGVSSLIRGALRGRPARALLGFVLLAFCAAPVPGDVGGCNQAAEELAPAAFFASKARIDCAHCGECAFVTDACARACEGSVQTEFSKDCLPLVHDGEACLRALDAANCSDYAAYVRDASPSIPTECAFCPEISE